MSFFEWLKTFFLGLFGNTPKDDTTPSEASEASELMDETTLLESQDSSTEMFEKFKFENIIYKKLDFLKEYIKSFEQSHPSEYLRYLAQIEAQHASYDNELESYQQGLEGALTFSIDPERESMRIAEISKLETDIYTFVDHVVLYDKYKRMFSVLCYKSNTLYNSIINWRISAEKLKEHFNDANSVCEKLISEVQQLQFFESDSRKKEKILQHIIYFDYLLFKSALRYGFCDSLNSYKSNISKLHKFFVDMDYDDSILRFFTQDLECIKTFLNTNLQSYEIYSHLLETCDRLKAKAQTCSSASVETSSFEEIIKIENTLEEAGKTCGVDFVLKLPEFFEGTVSKTASVNTIAISLLKLIDTDAAALLRELIKKFNINISWKEFYFLCKIFEVYEDVIQMSKSTIFTSVETKFLEFDQKYPQYSSSYITENKKKLLLYRGSKKKNYILLFNIGEIDCTFVASQLKKLQLDFLLMSDGIYLNYSYFKGFKNLEQFFGNHISI